MSDQRYSPPQASLEAEAPAARNVAPAPAVQALPIGGWLLLVAFGLIVTPFRLVYMLITNHWPVFRDGHWAALTDPASSAYHALWGPLIVFEIVANLTLMMLVATALALFFKKSRKAPRVIIAWHVVSVVVLLLDQWLGNMIPSVAGTPDSDQVKEMTRGLVGAAIWVPYFLVSKRVKNTFVH
jgi:hypothetical protein